MARYLRALPGWTWSSVATSSALAEPYCPRTRTTSSVRGTGSTGPWPGGVRAAQASTADAPTSQWSRSQVPCKWPAVTAFLTALPVRPTRRPASVVVSMTSSETAPGSVRAHDMVVVCYTGRAAWWIPGCSVRNRKVAGTTRGTESLLRDLSDAPALFQRQPVFGGEFLHLEVPAHLPGPLRILRGCSRLLPGTSSVGTTANTSSRQENRPHSGIGFHTPADVNLRSRRARAGETGPCAGRRLCRAPRAFREETTHTTRAADRRVDLQAGRGIDQTVFR